jgi:fatty acid desaturase
MSTSAPQLASEAPPGRPARPGSGVPDCPSEDRQPRRPSDFAPLVARIKEERLLDRRYVYYTRILGLNLLAFAAVAAAVLLVGESWWQMALAVAAAIVTSRSCFIGHDACHQQIAATRRANRIIALLHGNLLMGMSTGWWDSKHSRHHANPNHLEKDPDVAVGVLVWSADQTAGRRGLAGWLTRHQARLFFPLLLLEGLNLKLSGVLDLKNRTRREALLEGGLMLAHTAGYVALLLTAMSPLKALIFALVHHAVLGVHLGCSFAPNHKGMPSPEPGQKWDHLRRQVLTSRNVRGGPITDWVLGGLNYQVEHHLFPSMPRGNLRKAQPIVRRHCEELGLLYTEAGPIESYAVALRHMHAVGEPLRIG